MIEAVKLSREITPKFPNRCVFCSQTTTNQTIKLDSSYKGKYLNKREELKWNFVANDEIEVPAHADCYLDSEKIKSWRKRIYFVALAIFLIAISLVKIYEVEIPYGLYKTSIFVSMILWFTPIFLLEEFYLKTFGIKADKRKISYEFITKEYADEFLKLNKKAIEVEGLDEFEVKIFGSEKYLESLKFLFDKKYSDAVSSSTELLKLEPQNSHGYSIRGEALLRLRRFEEALKDFNKSLQISNENTDTLWLRSVVYRKLRKYKASKADRKLMKKLESEMKLSSGNEGFKVTL